MNETLYDLVSLGEVMLRMSPPRFTRLRHALQLDIYVAGAQLNVAANLARLGKRTAFISKLPDNELGLLARDACLGYGVDMGYVPLIPGARMGVNYLEFSATPRVPITVFDRKGSAASTITAADFDWQSILHGSRIAHTDGIFPGLSDGCREAAAIYLKTAKAEGALTSFDLNYREHLWTPESARKCWESLLPMVDILVTSRSASETVFGFTGTDEAIAEQYARSFGCQIVCFTTREILGLERGAWTSIAWHGGQIYRGRRYEFDVIDRYGTGDAYLAGFLFGILDYLSERGMSAEAVAFGLDFGNAACALAHTIEGDVIDFSASEVRPLLNETIDLRVRR